MKEKKMPNKLLNSIASQISEGKPLETISVDSNVPLSTLDNLVKRPIRSIPKNVKRKINKLHKENVLLKALAADQAMTIFKFKNRFEAPDEEIA